MFWKNAKWNFTVLAPDQICINEFWDIGSNIVVTLVQKRATLPIEIQNLSNAGWFRRETLEHYLENKLTLAVEPMEVEIHSDDIQFLPLFSKADDHVILLDIEDLSLSPLGAPRRCPIIMVGEGVGLAAFVGLASRASIAETLLGTSGHATVQLLVNNFIISQMPIGFKFDHMFSNSMNRISTKTYERIFASYAREDKAVVECVETIMQAFGTGELRWDLRVLRAGIDWEESIFKEIKAADSFQLFWSKHAKKSMNVRNEWRYALGLKRKEFIKPVYWEDPLPTPPSELKRINFFRIKLIS